GRPGRSVGVVGAHMPQHKFVMLRGRRYSIPPRGRWRDVAVDQQECGTAAAHVERNLTIDFAHRGFPKRTQFAEHPTADRSILGTCPLLMAHGVGWYADGKFRHAV